MRLSFAHCIVDTDSRELTRDGEVVDLQRLIFDLLLHFLTHPHTAVTRDALLSQVWGTVHVSDSVVARAVMKLRRAIGDDATDPQIIRTLHRVGYRFCLDVQTLPPTGGAAEPPPAPVAPASATAGVAVRAPLPASTLPAAPLRRGADLAFLPLINQLQDPNLDWACEGLPALLSHLCERRGALTLANPADVRGLDMVQGSLTERAQVLLVALGVNGVVASTLQRGDAGLCLSVDMYTTAPQPMSAKFTGAELVLMAQTATQWLLDQHGQHRAQAAATSANSADLELLARAHSELELTHFQTAVPMLRECVTRMPDDLRVHITLANCLVQMGELDQADGEVQRLCDRAEVVGDDVLKLEAFLVQAHMRITQGRLKEGGLALAKARMLAYALGDPDLDARVGEEESRLASRQGDLLRATACLESVVALLVSSSNKLAQTSARVKLSQVYVSRHLLTKATALLDRAKAMLVDVPSVALSAEIDDMAAFLAYERMNWSLCLHLLHKVQAHYEASGQRPRQWRATQAAISVQLELGQLAQARKLTEYFISLENAPPGWGPWRPQMLGAHQAVFLQEMLAEINWRTLGPAATPGLVRQAVLMNETPRYADLLPIRLCIIAARVARDLGPDAAGAQLQMINATVSPAEHEYVTAVIELARHDAKAAIARLDKLCSTMDLSSSLGVEVACSVCWLHLESGHQVPLEHLIAHIDDYCDEFPPAIVVRARFMMAQGQAAEARRELQRVLKGWSESPLPIVHELLARLDGQAARPIPAQMISHCLWA